MVEGGGGRAPLTQEPTVEALMGQGGGGSAPVKASYPHARGSAGGRHVFSECGAHTKAAIEAWGDPRGEGGEGGEGG